MRSNLISPDPSVSSSLKVSGVREKEQANKKEFNHLIFTLLHVRKCPCWTTELTEEELQTNKAAHKVVEVNAEVRFAIASHDDLMQGVVEREACPNAKKKDKKQNRKHWRWTARGKSLRWGGKSHVCSTNPLPLQPRASLKYSYSHCRPRPFLCTGPNGEAPHVGLATESTKKKSSTIFETKSMGNIPGTSQSWTTGF